MRRCLKLASQSNYVLKACKANLLPVLPLYCMAVTSRLQLGYRRILMCINKSNAHLERKDKAIYRTIDFHWGKCC